MSDAGSATSLRGLRGFIFDLDGTLYRGETALPGAAEFVANLRRAGAAMALSRPTIRLPRQRALPSRLTRMGIEAGSLLTY